jgi:hypothetical protein
MFCYIFNDRLRIVDYDAFFTWNIKLSKSRQGLISKDSFVSFPYVYAIQKLIKLIIQTYIVG